MTATLRWDLFDNAVKLARKYVQDEDAARDVALRALEEVGETSEPNVMQCVKRRAQDAVKAHVRKPFVANLDMDLLPGTDNVFDEVAANEWDRLVETALGSKPALVLKMIENGYTNADVGRHFGVSEEAARLARNAAEVKRDQLG